MRVLGIALPLALAACADPTFDSAREALGPEAPGIAPGPLHRPDQPCLLCHDGDHASAFTVAGTVHTTPDGPPAPGVRVHLRDALDRAHEAETNCAGNFFVRKTDFAPGFPFHVRLSYGSLEVAMESPIRRDGSCAGCHRTIAGPSSVGPVFLSKLTVKVEPCK